MVKCARIGLALSRTCSASRAAFAALVSGLRNPGAHFFHGLAGSPVTEPDIC